MEPTLSEDSNLPETAETAFHATSAQEFWDSMLFDGTSNRPPDETLNSTASRGGAYLIPESCLRRKNSFTAEASLALKAGDSSAVKTRPRHGIQPQQCPDTGKLKVRITHKGFSYNVGQNITRIITFHRGGGSTNFD